MKSVPSREPIRIFIGLVALFSLAACSQTPYAEQTLEQALSDEQLAPGNSVEEISYLNFDSWKYLDKYHMLVKTSRDEQYLISFTHRCSTFSKNSIPVFEYRTRTLTKFDSIKIMDSFGFGPEVCPIEAIVKLNAIDYDAPIEDE